MLGQCTECGRDGKVRKGLCDAHYFRLRRTGSVGTPDVAVRTPGAECTVDGCTQLCSARGYCRKHYMRNHRHGSPLATRESWPSGEANGMWLGDDVGYHGAHIRVRKARGKASDHTCRCGDLAAEWAYDHKDPNEKQGISGPYSIDVERYEPMCVRCHRQFDENPITTRPLGR